MSTKPGLGRRFQSAHLPCERIGDNNVVADGLHVERHIAAWQVFITKEFSEDRSSSSPHSYRSGLWTALQAEMRCHRCRRDP